MRSVTNAVAGAALLLGGVTCASTRQQAESPNPTTREVASAQQRSQEALARAHDAQKAAADQAKKAAEADAQVRQDQQKLERDQATARQEHAKAQQLQAQAEQETRRAAQEAQQQQQAAASGLAQQMQHSARGQQVAAGVVTQVRPDEIVLQPPSGDVMRFRLSDQTEVQVGGRQASANQIREGAEARVAYEQSANGPMAVRVSVNPSAGVGSTSGQESTTGTSAPGTSAPSAPDTGTGSTTEPASPQGATPETPGTTR